MLMNKKYQIDIDAYIGSWECSKRFVKNKLKEVTEQEVLVRVNSLGGDVDTAIDIASQFEAHGNVTCDMYAFNASAATVLTLGAKKVRMHENAMYLIHKAMVWVDEWGAMNEDDIDAVIEKLKSVKENAAVVTLNLAKMYASKSGKDIQEVLSLMKESRWLDAATAKEMGFIDEVFSGSLPTKKETNIVEMLNYAELPIPDNITTEPENVVEETEITRKDFLNEVVNSVKNLFSNNKNDDMKNQKLFKAVLLAAILNVESLTSEEGNIQLTEEQLTEIENDLQAKVDRIKDLEAAEKTAENKIADLQKELDAKNAAPGDGTEGVNHQDDGIVNSGKHAPDNSFVEDARALFNLV